jgi:hypothetical protein
MKIAHFACVLQNILHNIFYYGVTGVRKDHTIQDKIAWNRKKKI